MEYFVYCAVIVKVVYALRHLQTKRKKTRVISPGAEISSAVLGPEIKRCPWVALIAMLDIWEAVNKFLLSKTHLYSSVSFLQVEG